MKKINHIYLFMVAFICLCSIKTFTQEYVFPLNYNHAIKKNGTHHYPLRNDTMLMLPFFDDFSYDDIFPDNTKWTDKHTYVNNELCYKPVSYGVATFDALDENGRIYSHLHHNISRKADYLTSQPIRLDSIFDGYQTIGLHKHDSVYLSFFIQPANWDSYAAQSLPEDSLCLEFFSPADSSWHRVWSTYRFDFQSIDTSQNKGQYFYEVIIPITDEEKYFHQGFRFRFYNYVTLTNTSMYPGWQVNGSQWNLDYVFLDRNRRTNAFYKDVCFVDGANSFLKNYYSMPYNQYCEAPFDEMLDIDKVLISNLDNKPNNVGYNYIVTNENNEVLKEFQGGSGIIEPFYLYGYFNNPITNPPVFPFAFPTGDADSVSFYIKHFISSDLGFKQNDTIKFKQKFSNYYAYDDGSPEMAYTLLSPSKASLAVRFKLNKADTLRAVNIFFNDIHNAPEYLRYNLCIWNDQASVPNKLIYEENIKVHYDTLYNSTYVTYILQNPIVIDQTDFPHLVFYVGLEIEEKVEFAIGLDNSRNNSRNTYYNVLGEWTSSSIAGSLMIRPVLGKYINPMPGIKDNNTDYKLTVYPNPVVSENKIYIDNLHIYKEINYSIFNTSGYKCAEGILHKNSDYGIDVSSLNNGLYIIVLNDSSLSPIKFLISR